MLCALDDRSSATRSRGLGPRGASRLGPGQQAGCGHVQLPGLHRAPRVRDQNQDAPGQGELFPAWRCHAVFTDSPHELVAAEGEHRDHAIVEQVFADLYNGPLARLPSGKFNANAAWLSIAAMAQNLLRAAGALAGGPLARARGATIRRDLVAVAARIARHGRGRIALRLPRGWHRQAEWLSLWEAACGPPATAA